MSGKLPTGRFVIVQNMQDATAIIVRHLANPGSPIDRIYPMDMFRLEATRVMGLEGKMTDSDLHILLTHLARDEAAIAYNDHAVKFRGPEEALPNLTDQDVTIASLKALVADLHEQIAILSAHTASLSEKAKQAVVNKHRTAALAALKSKKLNEDVLRRRAESLSQLEEVYSKIEQAADQVAMVRVLEGSTSVLRNLYKDTGGLEKVEDVVGKLREETSKVDEVGGFLQAVGQDNALVHDDALDEELEGMLQDAEAQEKKQKALHTHKQHAELETIGKVPSEEPTEKGDVTPISTEEVTKTLKRVSLNEGQLVTNRSSSLHTAEAATLPNTEAAG
ncbi:MAG: hypothetical protein Q9217_005917 [Psora testacea]